MIRHKWRLALFATFADLFFITLIILFKHRLDNAGIIGLFFSYYLPYFLHAPLIFLCYGLNDRFLYFFLSIQTFLIFFLIGLGLEKRKKLSTVIGVVFYLFLLSLAMNATRNDYDLQKIVSTKDVENSINADLPIGSSQGKVIAYLKADGIDYTIDPKSLKIEAMERDGNKGLFISTSFKIVFHFNANGELTRSTVEEKLTGP